jgi:hypothetical protein
VQSYILFLNLQISREDFTATGRAGRAKSVV